MKWEHSGPTEIQVRDNDKNQMFFSTTEYTQTFMDSFSIMCMPYLCQIMIF